MIDIEMIITDHIVTRGVETPAEKVAKNENAAVVIAAIAEVHRDTKAESEADHLHLHIITILILVLHHLQVLIITAGATMKREETLIAMLRRQR